MERLSPKGEVPAMRDRVEMGTNRWEEGMAGRINMEVQTKIQSKITIRVVTKEQDKEVLEGIR